MVSDHVAPSDIQGAYEREREETGRVIALDSAARSATLEHGDEFASALRQCKRLIWAAAGFSGAVNLLFLASPIYLMEVYNRVIPSGSLATLLSLSFGLMLALATMAALDAVRARLLIKAAARLDRVLAHRVFEAIIDLAPRHGAIARNAQSLRDLDQFRAVLAGTGAQFFFDVPWMPLFLLVLFFISPTLGAIGLGGAVLLLLLAFWNDRRTRESGETAVAAANRSYRFTDSVARFADPVRAMGMTDALSINWHVDREQMLRRQAEGSDRTADFTALFRFVRLMLQSAMIGVGGWLVVKGSMNASAIFAANIILGRALAPLEVAVSGWRAIAQGIQAGRRVQTALIQAPPRTSRVRPPSRNIDIDVRDVSFVPPGAKQAALKNLTFRIVAGEAVGIVGPSGAGKSTLARLLTAVTNPTSGKVLVGGIEGKHWTDENLADFVGYLPQTVGLFPGTIRDNIARFSDADDAAVIEAATRANVHEMILGFPEGYETRVDEGGFGLSGGQRQRIGLARAMFGSPRLLVLDEPNAHLDADGDEALAGALATLRDEGSTIILIAHRLNPIQHVDRVMVLCEGEVQLDGPRQRVFRKVKTELVRSIASEPVPA